MHISELNLHCAGLYSAAVSMMGQRAVLPYVPASSVSGTCSQAPPPVCLPSLQQWTDLK